MEEIKIFQHKYYFEPQKLLELANDLKVRVKSNQSNNILEITGIANRINSMNTKDALSYQSTLKYKVIQDVIEYYNYNYMHYNSKNFFYVVESRYRSSMKNNLYHMLQNSYANEAFKKILEDQIEELGDKLDLSLSYIRFVLDFKSNKEVFEYFFSSGSTFFRVVKSYKIITNTVLYNAILASVLLYGQKKDFDALDYHFIIERSLQMKANDFSIFLNNFFRIYTIGPSYLDFITDVVNKYGAPYKRNPHYMWETVDHNLKIAIRRMMNKIKISNAFGKDERSVYWSSKVDYMDDIIHSPINDIIIMYMNQIVVVEYTKKGNAAYFYDRDFFNNKFSRKLDQLEVNLVIKKDTLKEKQYDRALAKYRLERGNYDYKEPNNTVSHAKNWQKKMNRYLQLKGVL